MLTFTCEYCSSEYKDVSVDNGKIVYMTGNKRITVDEASHPCHECSEYAEKAKKDALKERKTKTL